MKSPVLKRYNELLADVKRLEAIKNELVEAEKIVAQEVFAAGGVSPETPEQKAALRAAYDRLEKAMKAAEEWKP